MLLDLSHVSLWLLRVALALAFVLGFALLGRVAGAAVRGTVQRVPARRDVGNLFGRSVQFFLVFIGVILALSTLGVDVSALLASLGLTGFALGFALRDAISNFVAGLLLLMYRPFRLGDCVKVIGYQGSVAAIDLRYVTLQGDGEQFLIPNSSLFTNPITLVMASPIASES